MRSEPEKSEAGAGRSAGSSFPERLPHLLRHLPDNIAVGDQRKDTRADPRGRIAEGRQQVIMKMHGQPGSRRAAKELRDAAAHWQKPIAAALHCAPEAP